jgi:hypothetical protein
MTAISLTMFEMRQEENTPHKFESLSELHRALGLPNPQHPLISLIVNDVKDVDVNRLPQYYILTYYVCAPCKAIDRNEVYAAGFPSCEDMCIECPAFAGYFA